MPRKSVVKELGEEQLEFVIQRILAGDTDREISLAFQTAFDKPLAKSSLNRWRVSAGNELADRYRLARYQAKQFLEDVGESNADKFQAVMGNIEDRLLTATREVITRDPLKLLKIRQEEEKRRLKERELELKREHLELEREKLRGSAIDRVALGGEFLADLLAYLDTDTQGLTFFKRHAKPFQEFLNDKYASS